MKTNEQQSIIFAAKQIETTPLSNVSAQVLVILKKVDNQFSLIGILIEIVS